MGFVDAQVKETIYLPQSGSWCQIPVISPIEGLGGEQKGCTLERVLVWISDSPC
ncbi:unnamed protein product [Moneuplotes crassus]|uniref:Uncharacterized protein n=1 Tax=Euplotes crassus TaxID=5936 RepID=A0AAD1XTE7_EUPCR|nr:unnamed protein product [Moneuplotes crassus]